MAFEQKISVAETSTTTGTGAYALGGALSGRRAFSVHADGATVLCRVTMGTDWEYGRYTFASGANTLTRTAVLKSTNSNNAVNWGAGTKTIREVPEALSDVDATTLAGILSLMGLGTEDSPTFTGLTLTNALAIAGALTGVTDLTMAGGLTGLTGINEGPLAGWRNLLINPDGRFLERAPASNADNTHGHDRWLALTQTSTIAVSTVSDAESGTPRMARLTQSQASAQRMGYAQWIEGANCRWLRGKNVTLSGRIKFSLNAAVRYAICEWTGTEDTPSTARDIVNDWTSSTYTASNFFKGTTFNVLAVGSITPAAATLTDLTKLTAAVGASCNNLVVFIWTEGTAAQNATLDVALQLEVGQTASKREFRPKAIEKALCNWYYLRKQALAQYDLAMSGCSYQTNVAQHFADSFPEMRTAPTGAISSAGDFRIAVIASVVAATSLSLLYAGKNNAFWQTANNSFTQGVPGILHANTSSAWLSYDAEI